LAWLTDMYRMVYPHKWSPISCKWSAGQGKFAGKRSAFYHCAMQPSGCTFAARQDQCNTLSEIYYSPRVTNKLYIWAVHTLRVM